MPTPRHGKNTRVYAGVNAGTFVELSQITNDAGLAVAVDSADVTTHDNTGDREFLAGLRTRTVSLSGISDFSTAGPGESIDRSVIEAYLGSTARMDLAVMVEGNTTGRAAVVTRGRWDGYQLTSPAQDVVKFSASMVNGDQSTLSGRTPNYAGHGVVLWNRMTSGITATTSGPSLDGGAASATTGVNDTNGQPRFYHAQVWLSSITAGTVKVNIQHSSNGSAWADLTALTAMSSGGTVRSTAKLSVAMKRYVRATASSVAGGGTSKLLVTMARSL